MLSKLRIMKILVTGASGFIGSHLVAHALQLKHEVWAAIRSTSNYCHLKDDRIQIIELNYTDSSELNTQLYKHYTRYGKWDVIIHCAGATKCTHRKDFYTINNEYTHRFVDTLILLDMVPRQFIFMSTLGTYGPICESKPYLPIRETDSPCPNTDYGRSKRMAEEYLMSLPSFPYVIFRPTGVYGPRDKDYKILIDSIRRHVDISLNIRPQKITFVYVYDLTKAIFLAINKGVTRRNYFVTDGNVYTARDFSEIVKRTLRIRRVWRIAIPLWIARGAAIICDGISVITGHSLTFNSDKYRILKQRNWTCDIEPLINELDYRPQYNLQQGVEDMLG